MPSPQPQRRALAQSALGAAQWAGRKRRNRVVPFAAESAVRRRGARDARMMPGSHAFSASSASRLVFSMRP
jgi:hypothetical protein